jgi:hypothetical protein
MGRRVIVAYTVSVGSDSLAPGSRHELPALNCLRQLPLVPLPLNAVLLTFW